MEVSFKIENPNQLEKQLFAFLKQQKQDLEEVTVDALNNFIKSFQKKEKFSYVKRDPRNHSRKREYIDEENEYLSDVKPYAHVEDSGQYIHDLRRVRDR